MTHISLTGVGGPSEVIGRTAGYYYHYSSSATPPLPNSVHWLPDVTGNLNDGVSPDHTTYLSSVNSFGATNYMHIMYYVESPLTLSSYKLSWAWLGILAATVNYSENGTVYATFDPVAVSDHGGVLTFEDLNQNPADVTAIACVVSAQDTPGIAGIPCQVRISEFIPVFA
jgi:hypothetical protein